MSLHIVFDFGGVIGLGQPDGTLQALAAVADVDDERFTERYWRFREAYDLGMDAADYWTAVAGVPSLSPAVVQRLTDRDVECWTRLDRDTLDILHDLRSRRLPLTLLSDAPHAQADVVERMPELRDLFTDLVFSCRLGVAKPHPDSYAWTTRRIPSGSRIVFIDDRPENLDPSRLSGWTPIRFRSAARLRSDLGDLISEERGEAPRTLS